ncbi:hypothetical protein K438DRAFT_855713 [Mycena galopus ATCC 62051]|nr:hypothetical protein K438DRAFT_855713 [Mycena galopus ATCC 62051]
MTVPLIDTVHYKILVRPTLVAHEHTRELWKQFATTHMQSATLPIEIIPGSVIPPWDITKEFVRWLGIALQGRLGTFVTKKTVRRHIQIFFSLWRHYAFTVVPSEHRLHVWSFLASPEFQVIAQLTTQSRQKNTANFFDLEVIVKGILEDVKYFRTTRARLGMVFAVLVSALSSERPGAIVESNCYRSSNEALTWGNLQFWIIPNPKLPPFPLACLILTTTLLKGHRQDESFVKPFFVLPEPASHRHVDVMMYALAGALEDEIFEDVTTIEEIFCPAAVPTKAHCLRIKPSCVNLPVIRKEVFDNGRWTNSSKIAMPYHMAASYLRKTSLSLGFVESATFYDFRRMAAMHLDAALGDNERRRLMGQNPGSDEFYKSYQSRLLQVDLGAIMADRLDANPDNAYAMKEVAGMSKGRDPAAPISLNSQERNELLADEELVDMRVEKAKLRERIQEIRWLPALTDAEQEVGKQQIALLVTQIRNLDRKHGAIVSRETRALIREKRRKYHEGTSRRQLAGTASPQRLPLMSTKNVPRELPPVQPSAAPGKENRPPRGSASSLRPPSDPMKDALDIICNFTVDTPGSVPADEASVVAAPAETVHFVNSVNALLGLPERPPKPCYPAQSLTPDGDCPFCDVEMTVQGTNAGGGNVATHVHACYSKEIRRMAQKSHDDAYNPTTCSWAKCKKGSHVWQTRAEFCAHIDIHLDKLRYPLKGVVPTCKWKTVDDDEPCGATDCEDVEAHFATEHLLNICEDIKLDYCAICAEFFVDHEGDRSVWHDHCDEHYSTLFLPFETQVDAEVSFENHGVEFTPLDLNAVQFELGEGLGGARPEFHGDIQGQIPLSPCFCPMCVFDDQLPIEARMRQFFTNKEFQTHLKIHSEEKIAAAAEEKCPVPSCGTHRFEGAFEFLWHMVVYHRVPICGSTNHSAIRRLRLPTREDTDPPQDETDTMAVDPVDLAHAASAPIRASTSAQTSAVASGSTDVVAAPRKKRKKGPRVLKLHKCYEHRMQFVDIREHIPDQCSETRFKIRDPKYSRAAFGEFVDFAEWIKTAPPRETSTATAGTTGNNVDDDEDDDDEDDQPLSKKPRVEAQVPEQVREYNFKCNACKKEFPDILKHFAALRKPSSKCQQRRFSERLPTGGFGAVMTLAQWNAANASSAAVAGSVTTPSTSFPSTSAPTASSSTSTSAPTSTLSVVSSTSSIT